MKTEENFNSIASNDRIEKLITEAHNELAKIQPEIVYLEECQKKLAGLKNQQFKLQSLIISLKSILKSSDENIALLNKVKEQDSVTPDDVNINNAKIMSVNSDDLHKIFLPDQAISQVKNYLRVKNNLNYEIFKAVVFNSGSATTQEIKQYLVENKIKQPKTGKGFENIELKEISSRANYLVRKKILTSPEPGLFRSAFGWSEIK